MSAKEQLDQLEKTAVLQEMEQHARGVLRSLQFLTPAEKSDFLYSEATEWVKQKHNATGIAMGILYLYYGMVLGEFLSRMEEANG